MVFQWIKAHVGHTRNEKADLLAKKGAEAVVWSRSILGSLCYQNIFFWLSGLILITGEASSLSLAKRAADRLAANAPI